MMLRLFFTLSLITFFISANGQAPLPLGTWKSHLPFKNGIRVTQSPKTIIYSSERGIILFNKEDLSIDFLNKEDGVSDSNVSDVIYDQFNKQLIIIYSDNNIDIVRGNDIINLPFIKSNTTIIGSKDINQVSIIDNKTAYFATDFGVIGFNTQSLEFFFTTFTNLPVYSVTEFNGKIFIGTSIGLYSVPDTGVNLTDFGKWQKQLFDTSVPSTTTVEFVTSKFDHIYLATEDKVYKSPDGVIFTPIFTKDSDNDVITFLSSDNPEVMIGIQGNNSKSCVVLLDQLDQKTIIGTGCASRVVDAVQDEQGRIWFGDLYEPINYLESINGGCRRIEINGPSTLRASRFAFTKDATYIASQGITENLQPTDTRSGFYKYDKDGWTNFNSNTLSILQEKDFASTQAIAIDKTTSDIYIGGFWNGVIRFNEETGATSHWNKDNSSLQGIVGDVARTRIGGLTFDNNNNLWASNYGAPKPLAVKTSNDEWYSFSVPGATFISDIIIDDANNKWIIDEGVGNGIIVYNEGQNIPQTSDDKVRYINKNNSEITGNRVNCIVKDLDGSIWVGTDQGPVIFDQRDPFDNTNRGSTQTVVVDGIPAKLLAAEDVLAIAVDGANRKWFGTRNGLFVQSPNGKEAIDFFNSKNSPLIDNKVTHLDFNPFTGEMFIITDGGIQSYKTETTIGGSRHSSQVYAFPNPVRPDYHGDIAIKGLARDANVKITDVNGFLVYETTALGGQAIWNGMDYNGNRAATGVYLVFASTSTNITSPDAIVTKILIVQ